MGLGDHPKTFLLKALCCQPPPWWLKVRRWHSQVYICLVQSAICKGEVRSGTASYMLGTASRMLGTTSFIQGQSCGVAQPGICLAQPAIWKGKVVGWHSRLYAWHRAKLRGGTWHSQLYVRAKLWGGTAGYISEENLLCKFIQTSYIKQIHQNSEYLLDKCYIFFFKLLNLIFLIQSSAVVNNKACKLAHYLMLVVNVPGC